MSLYENIEVRAPKRLGVLASMNLADARPLKTEPGSYPVAGEDKPVEKERVDRRGHKATIIHARRQGPGVYCGAARKQRGRGNHSIHIGRFWDQSRKGNPKICIACALEVQRSLQVNRDAKVDKGRST